jgi:hypothetical protein
MTLPWLLERFAAARTRMGAGIAVIDPWNEVSIASKPIDWTTAEWISQSLREIKRFARQHDIVVIIVAHQEIGAGQERQGAPADALGYC